MKQPLYIAVVIFIISVATVELKAVCKRKFVSGLELLANRGPNKKVGGLMSRKFEFECPDNRPIMVGTGKDSNLVCGEEIECVESCYNTIKCVAKMSTTSAVRHDFVTKMRCLQTGKARSIETDISLCDMKPKDTGAKCNVNPPNKLASRKPRDTNQGCAGPNDGCELDSDCCRPDPPIHFFPQCVDDKCVCIFPTESRLTITGGGLCCDKQPTAGGPDYKCPVGIEYSVCNTHYYLCGPKLVCTNTTESEKFSVMAEQPLGICLSESAAAAYVSGSTLTPVATAPTAAKDCIEFAQRCNKTDDCCQKSTATLHFVVTCLTGICACNFPSIDTAITGACCSDGKMNANRGCDPGIQYDLCPGSDCTEPLQCVSTAETVAATAHMEPLPGAFYGVCSP